MKEYNEKNKELFKDTDAWIDFANDSVIMKYSLFYDEFQEPNIKEDENFKGFIGYWNIVALGLSDDYTPEGKRVNEEGFDMKGNEM